MKNHGAFETSGPEEDLDPNPETPQNLSFQPDNEVSPHGGIHQESPDPWTQLRDLEQAAVQLRTEAQTQESLTQAFILARLGFVPQKPEYWTCLDWSEDTWSVQSACGVFSGCLDTPDHQLADPDGNLLHRVPELGLAWIQISSCNLWIFRLDKEMNPVQGPLPEVYHTGKPRE